MVTLISIFRQNKWKFNGVSSKSQWFLKGIPMVFKCVFPYSVVMAGSVNGTRCCTLRRAKNTPTHSFVSRTVNRK